MSVPLHSQLAVDVGCGGRFEPVPANRGVDDDIDIAHPELGLAEDFPGSSGARFGRRHGGAPETAFGDSGHQFKTADRKLQSLVE